jgi:hypothetical protein
MAIEGLNEELAPQFADYDDVNALAQAFVDLSGKTWRDDLGDLAGHDKVKEAKLAEIVKGFIDAPEPRSVPESPEQYKLPENFKIKGFRKFAHEAKLTQEDVDNILKFNSNHVKSLNEAAKQQRAEGVESLKKEWGEDFDTNKKLATLAVGYFDDEGKSLSTFLKDTGASKNPVVMKLFHKIGGFLKEDGYIKSSDFTSTPKGKSLAERLYPDHGK